MSGPYQKSPEHGVRFELIAFEASLEGATYRGHAHLPGASVPLEVRARKDAAEVSLGDAEAVDATQRAAIEKAASALVRAATRSELAAGEALPRKIVRWRAL